MLYGLKQRFAILLFVIIHINMEISQYESDILDMEYDLERMSYLQRKSRIRLQVISKGKRPFLRSIQDEHSTLRIFVIGLLLKIYGSTDNRKDQYRINKFKEIVYNSQLESLTTSRGLYREQLHKNVAVHLLKLQACTNIEEELLGCFNCVAFFDEVLMISFKEHFKFDKGEEVQFWAGIMQQEFLLRINWSDKLRISCNDKITITRDADELNLPSTAALILDETEGASILTSNDQSFEKTQGLKRKIVQTVSIDESIQSPLHLSANENKQNINRLNCTRKITPFEANVGQPRHNKREPFWSMFCCGSD